MKNFTCVNRALTGVIFPDGPLWREQRKFMVTTMRELGVGKRSMEEHIQDEFAYCQRHIEHLIETVTYKRGNLAYNSKIMFLEYLT